MMKLYDDRNGTRLGRVVRQLYDFILVSIVVTGSRHALIALMSRPSIQLDISTFLINAHCLRSATFIF